MSNWVSLLLLMGLFSCGKNEIDIGENIHVSREWSSYPHAEVHLAIHPDNSNQMVAAAFAFKESGGKDQPAAYITNDGGKSWSRINVESPGTGAADPWVVIENNTINYAHLPGILHVSTDGGKSWKSNRFITRESGNSLDFLKLIGNEKELYAVATNNLPTKDSSYIDPVTVFRINENQQILDSIHILPDSINYKNGVPVITKDGLLIVPYYELLDRNRDLLDTNTIWISHIDTKKFELIQSYKSPLTGGEISLALNQKFNNRLHLVSPTKTGQGFKLQYAHSDDLGRTWSKRVLIEDFERDPESVTLSASLAVSGNGTLGILWPDHRTDSTNQKYGMYFMYSEDGGVTFSKSYLISEISSPKTEKNISTIIDNSGRSVSERFWVGGDYYGLVPVGESAFQAAWVDSRTGVAQVWTCKIAIL